MRYTSLKSIKNTTFPRLINTFLLKSTMALSQFYATIQINLKIIRPLR